MWGTLRDHNSVIFHDNDVSVKVQLHIIAYLDLSSLFLVAFSLKYSSTQMVRIIITRRYDGSAADSISPVLRRNPLIIFSIFIYSSKLMHWVPPGVCC